MDTRRIVVISDTHKDFAVLKKIVDRHRMNADLFIHLGDVEEDVRRLRAIDPDLPIRNVRGNCDFGSRSKAVDILTLGKAKILFCHGHTMFVGAGTDTLEAAAREAGCCVTDMAGGPLQFAEKTSILAAHPAWYDYLAEEARPFWPAEGGPL